VQDVSIWMGTLPAHMKGLDVLLLPCNGIEVAAWNDQVAALHLLLLSQWLVYAWC
jgi:hypothetical protein